MFHILDPNHTRDFSFPDDTENPAVFKLGAIPSRVLSAIEKSTQKFKINPPRAGAETVELSDFEVDLDKRFFETVKFGLKGWNLAVEFRTQEYDVPGAGKVKGVAEDLLDRIPKPRLQTLHDEIRKECGLDKEEEKNS